MAIVGYARVSTDGQSVDAQVAELKDAGATNVFQETVSGAVTDRAALKRALAPSRPAMSLLVTRLDRLTRSTRDLLNILDDVAKRGAGFRFLRDVWVDTTTPHGRLMLTVCSADLRNLSASRCLSGPAKGGRGRRSEASGSGAGRS